MAAKKKKTATKRITGTKAKRGSSAGKTARAPAHKVARTARQEAEGIRARMKRSPDYWAQLREEMAAESVRPPPRVAQVEPTATH